MARKIRETHYSLRSTFFRNNYEEPGEEFDIDPEDPVGLVSSQLRRDVQNQIHADPVPGLEMEERRIVRLDVLESDFRTAARRASRMDNVQLVNETLVLAEFIGKALKSLRNVWQRGLFQSIGRGLATITKKALGGQKDADRNFTLNAEKQFIEKFSTQTADGTEIDFKNPNTVKAIVGVVEKYINELDSLASDSESVFPRYGRVHIGGKGEDEEEKDTTGREDRVRFAKEQQSVNRHLSGLVKASGTLRGVLFAIRRTLREEGSDVKISDPVVDATYPLTYVISNFDDTKRVFEAIDEKFEGGEIMDALNDMETATQKFDSRFRPELEKLQRKMMESAVARLIANRAVLQERRLLD